MSNQKNLSHFLKTWFWSKTLGHFIDQETGKEIKQNKNYLSVGPIYTGTASEWCDIFVDLLFDASNHVQLENNVKPYSIASFNRETKKTSYVECFSPVQKITVGTDAWETLYNSKRFSKQTEFTGSIDEKIQICFDPMYSNSVVVVGEYGKNPILISVVD